MSSYSVLRAKKSPPMATLVSNVLRACAMRRVTRGPIIQLTFDPSHRPWLTDYTSRTDRAGRNADAGHVRPCAVAGARAGS